MLLQIKIKFIYLSYNWSLNPKKLPVFIRHNKFWFVRRRSAKEKCSLYRVCTWQNDSRQLSGSNLQLQEPSRQPFCSALEQAVNLTPNDQNTALFYKLDDFRKKYHALGG